MTLNQGLAIAGIGTALLAIWTFHDKFARPETGQAFQLPTAKEVRTVEKVAIQPKVVYVYPDKVKDNLGLPKEIQQDKNKHVTATGKLDAEDRPYTLTAVMDSETGQSEVYARPDPLPWLAPGKYGAVGVAYGMRNGEPMGRLYAKQELVRVKALNAGLTGTLDQDGQWFAGAYVEFRF